MTEEFDPNQAAESVANEPPEVIEVDAQKLEEVSGGAVVVAGSHVPAQLKPADVKALLKDQEEIRAMVLDYINRNLKDGTDYGPAYPGTTKKNLLKPGSEKVNSLLQIRIEFAKDQETWEMVKNSSPSVCYICRGIRNGQIVGEGRGAVEIGEKKWGINQVIKMAEKRAQVDMTLRVAGISDLFTQDAEDLNKDRPAKATKAADHKPFADAKKKAQGGGGKFSGKTLKELGQSGEGMRRAMWAIINSHTSKIKDVHPDDINEFSRWFFQVKSMTEVIWDKFQKFSDVFSLSTYDRDTKTATDKSAAEQKRIHGMFLENWEQYKKWMGGK